MSLSIHGISEPASGTPKFCLSAGSAALHRGTAVDIENRRRRIARSSARAVERAHLLQQFAHVLRARARGGLIRHGRLIQSTRFAQEQAADAISIQADRAIAADEIPAALDQRILDHVG